MIRPLIRWLAFRWNRIAHQGRPMRTRKPWLSWITLIVLLALLRPNTIPYPIRALIGIAAFAMLIRVCIYLCQPFPRRWR